MHSVLYLYHLGNSLKSMVVQNSYHINETSFWLKQDSFEGNLSIFLSYFLCLKELKEKIKEKKKKTVDFAQIRNFGESLFFLSL